MWQNRKAAKNYSMVGLAWQYPHVSRLKTGSGAALHGTAHHCFQGAELRGAGLGCQVMGSCGARHLTSQLQRPGDQVEVPWSWSPCYQVISLYVVSLQRRDGWWSQVSLWCSPTFYKESVKLHFTWAQEELNRRQFPFFQPKVSNWLETEADGKLIVSPRLRTTPVHAVTLGSSFSHTD